MKPDPNHRQYIEVLRALGAEHRLRKALELSELARDPFLTGLRERHPSLDEAALRRLYLQGLEGGKVLGRRSPDGAPCPGV